MSRIGRASRNASLLRLETITADKALLPEESGETFLLDYNTAAALTITLPAMKQGAYFKFIFKTDFTANGTIVFTVRITRLATSQEVS